MVKCRYCKKEIEKDNAVKVGKATYYCSQECQELAEAKKHKSKTKESDKETQDRKALTDLIQEYYLDEGYSKDEINWHMIMAQIKNMKDTYGYKYSGIRYCLWYMREICEKPLFDESYNGSILNLVPFEYQNAQIYWREDKALKKAFEAFQGVSTRKIKKDNNLPRKIIPSVDF